MFLFDEINIYRNFFQVIQRRYNGEINFYRNWNDYKYGFGSVDNEIWLGNHAILLH